MTSDLPQSKSRPKLYIAGMGMITPVGANAAMAAAAINAGVSAYAESPEFFISQRHAIVTAAVPVVFLMSWTSKLMRVIGSMPAMIGSQKWRSWP